MPRRSVSRRQDAVNAEAGTEGRRTPAGDALSELWVRVFQLGGLFAAAGDALARPAGQTSARWQVMAALEDGPMTVAQVARRLRQARQTEWANALGAEIGEADLRRAGAILDRVLRALVARRPGT